MVERKKGRKEEREKLKLTTMKTPSKGERKKCSKG